MNDSDIIIRRVVPGDAAALRSIRLEALRSDPTGFSADHSKDEARTLAEWRQRIEDSVVFMAWDGDQPVGMAGFYRGQSAKTQHQGGVWGVYVQQEQRGRGLCGRLVNSCLQWARDNGLRMAYIGVNATNTAAIRCYIRCGFNVYGVQPQALFYDGVYYDEILMAQPLRGDV